MIRLRRKKDEGLPACAGVNLISLNMSANIQCQFHGKFVYCEINRNEKYRS